MTDELFKLKMKVLDKYELGLTSRNLEFLKDFKESDFQDEQLVKDTIFKLCQYINHTEYGTNKYSEEIMKYLRQRRGLDKYDFSEDDEINKLSSEKVFSEVLTWNGFLCWSDIIIDWIEQIYKIKLEDK